MAENINNEVIIQLEEEPKAKRCNCKCTCKRSKAPKVEDCPVCYEVMTTRMITLKPWTRRVTLKPCNHQFCKRCVNTIVEGLENGEHFRCPLCRQNVEDQLVDTSHLTRIRQWKSKCLIILCVSILLFLLFCFWIFWLLFATNPDVRYKVTGIRI